MTEFMAKYGTEAKCRRALYRTRWPRGFRRPACGDRRRSTFRRGHQTCYQCWACGHQTTLVCGTLLASTNLPLTKWFLAMRLLTSTKTNLAALELMRHLDVCYRAVWRLKQKLTQAMTEREEPRRLRGFVQVDDAYLGGQRNGGKARRGSENKQAFVAAVETDESLEHLRCAVLEPVPTFDNAAVSYWAERWLTPDAEVYTDGLAALRRFRPCAQRAGNRGWARRDRSPRGALGQHCAVNVKRALDGVYHQLKQRRYARRYLGEATYRVNRRFRLPETLPRLARAVALRKPCPEPFWRATTNYPYYG